MSKAHHVLLLGGHGKISLLLTPLLVTRGWRVTSVIRDRAQEGDILAAAAEGKTTASTSSSSAASEGGAGSVDVLVESLEDVKSVEQASGVLGKVKPDYVVWSAGAGGKGGPTRTLAIDRDAASYFIRASCAPSSGVQKFLMVSAASIRRHRAPWWTDEDWKSVQHVNTQVMPTYYQAKLAADEVLTVLGEKSGLSYVVLRPGALVDDPPTGKVSLGRTRGRGKVTRADVADVAARLLEATGAKGWYDLLEGDEEAGKAVQRVLKDGVDCREGESLEEMEANIV